MVRRLTAAKSKANDHHPLACQSSCLVIDTISPLPASTSDTAWALLTCSRTGVLGSRSRVLGLVPGDGHAYVGLVLVIRTVMAEVLHPAGSVEPLVSDTAGMDEFTHHGSIHDILAVIASLPQCSGYQPVLRSTAALLDGERSV